MLISVGYLLFILAGVMVCYMCYDIAGTERGDQNAFFRFIAWSERKAYDDCPITFFVVVLGSTLTFALTGAYLVGGTELMLAILEGIAVGAQNSQ